MSADGQPWPLPATRQVSYDRAAAVWTVTSRRLRGAWAEGQERQGVLALQRGTEHFFFFVSFWQRLGVSRLEEKRLTKVQTKQVQLFDFCFRKAQDFASLKIKFSLCYIVVLVWWKISGEFVMVIWFKSLCATWKWGALYLGVNHVMKWLNSFF